MFEGSDLSRREGGTGRLVIELTTLPERENGLRPYRLKGHHLAIVCRRPPMVRKGELKTPDSLVVKTQPWPTSLLTGGRGRRNEPTDSHAWGGVGPLNLVMPILCQPSLLKRLSPNGIFGPLVCRQPPCHCSIPKPRVNGLGHGPLSNPEAAVITPEI